MLLMCALLFISYRLKKSAVVTLAANFVQLKDILNYWYIQNHSFQVN